MAVTNLKVLSKEALAFYAKYNVKSLSFEESKNYTKAWVVFTDDSSVFVTRIPKTTRTPDKFVAQNVLNSAYKAWKCDLTTACYSA